MSFLEDEGRGWWIVFFFQAEDGIRDKLVTGVQTCALPISASASRRPPDDSVPANVPPGPILGAARPNGCGLVWWMLPSFFGYPCTSPRASAKSVSTQMNTHREYTRPPNAHRTTAKHSRYWARTGSSSSSPLAPQDCQSAQITATAPGSCGASSSGAGSSAATLAGSVRYSTVSRSPE